MLYKLFIKFLYLLSTQFVVAEQCSITEVTRCLTCAMVITRHISTRGPPPRKQSTSWV